MPDGTRKKVEIAPSCGKKAIIMTRSLCKNFLILMPFFMAGCLTLVDDGAIGEQRAGFDAMKAEVSRLHDQVAELRQSVAKIQDEIQVVQNMRGSETKDSKSRLDEIDRNLKAVEASHDALKREIVEELARKIEKLGSMTAGTPVRTSVKSGASRQEGKKAERGYEHVVKAGENLSVIASAYGVTPSVIVKANNLTSPDALRIGQKLFIPE